MSDFTIEVHKRETKGKNSNRRLREAGLVPAVVYGGDRESVAIQLDRRSLLDLMRSTEGHNPIFLLKMAGTDKSRHAMIRDLQVDPVDRQVLHVDFQRILMTEKLRVMVHVEPQGVPKGVKNEGGMMDFVTREVEIECLPDKIPPKIVIDVSGLEIGDHVEAKELQMPEGVELLEEPEMVIVSVSYAKMQVEIAAEEEEGLLEAAQAEPEVIGRGKAEAEDEAGEDEG
jgi:large subunit ribosomal protein L25